MLWLLAVSTATAVPCALRATPLPDPGLSPELRAVAPQYFHASHRGGFDAYRGRGNVFPWFDLYDLRVGVRPPAMVRISASTDSWLVGMSVKAETPWPTLLLPRSGAGRRRIIGHERYPIEALERATGEVLVLARGSGQLYLLRVPPDPSAAVTELGLGLPDAAFDVRLGRTADDHPILAWLARDGDRLEVRASWSLDPADGIVVDAVTLSPAVAELSGRSRVELALAADGDHDLAIAWRPLADPDYPDVLPEVAYPTTPARAEVRWRVVAPDAPAGPIHRSPVIAMPLGGVTGVPPWPLGANGLAAGRLEGAAVFAWFDPEARAVVGVVAQADIPAALVTETASPRIAIPDDGTGRLLTLWSDGEAQAFGLACAP